MITEEMKSTLLDIETNNPEGTVIQKQGIPEL